MTAPPSEIPRLDGPVPDFFVAGAMKCGTSAMHHYLAGHPRVAMPARKEPEFWSRDVPSADRVADPDAYLALWAGAPAGALRGEATPMYVMSELAADAILRHRPEARFVVMLRPPVEMAHSLHSERVKKFTEDEGDFERAWRLQPARRRGERVPRECPDPRLLDYAWFCAVGDHLERFAARVAPEQRLVVLFDDLRRDTRREYLRVLEFLGLPDDGRRDFARVNANVSARSLAVARAKNDLPRRLGRLYAPARAAADRLGWHPLRMIDRVNVRHAPRPPLDAAFEAELRAHFAPQVDKLEAVLGRPLPDWR